MLPRPTAPDDDGPPPGRRRAADHPGPDARARASFLDACGARGPLVVRTSAPGADGGEPRVLRQPFAVIGGHPEADLRLEHPDVGRRHAYLQVVEGRTFCIDLDSRTGVRIGGVPADAGWVDPSATVEIGPFGLALRPNDAGRAATVAGGPSPLSAAYTPGSPLVGATLEIARGSGVLSAWPIRRALVLAGRSPRCKLRLEGGGASNFYAGLLRTPAAVWLVDLLSTGGVFVNDERVRFARLDEGDQVRIGPYRMRLRYDVAVEPLGGPELRPDRGPAADASPAAGVPQRSGGGRLAPIILTMPGLPERQPPAPEGPATGGGESPALMALVEQVGQMQMQMCDQFQQALVMLSQIFGTMHRDYMDAVREELGELRGLTEQIERLKAQLDAAPAPAQPGATSFPGPSPEPSEAAPGDTPKPPRRDPQEVHALVSERLAAFELERRGRWEKILRMMMK